MTAESGILWYVDRLGITPSYRPIWTQLLARFDVPPLDVRTVSLHKVLNGTLLAKYKNRNAPTWVEDRAEDIIFRVQADIAKHKPKVIVLSAPEALAVLGMDPQIATLFNLRGGLYHVQGIKTLVMLPISAWVNQVSIKTIGDANYGETDADDFDSQSAEERHGIVIEDDEGEDDGSDPQDSIDSFWYEPVIVPVGKFMLTADVAKLSRIYADQMGTPFNAY